uniref:Retinoic acid receptor responder protein 2 n=1 Tax=Oncorhynchus tshawytscha TaxID=74940 RepID=A0A8C8D7T8_ONCTS
MSALLLLLLSAGVLLSSIEAQEAYSKLPDKYRKGVDLALQQLNSHSGVQRHYLFFKSLLKSEIEPGFDVSYIYHNFYLKATKCGKGTVDATQCEFRDDRPLIDCAICYKTFAGKIEKEPKPYVHCLHKPALTEDMKTARVDHCNTMSYQSGDTTILASKGSK